MKTETVNKRFHYSYLDSDKGTLNGYIDLDVAPEDEISDFELQKYVARKWERIQYYNGFIDTVQIQSVQ